ncbi:hypothetical protein [Metamycoplasma hyosynoviae]|uniref:hypothetical protein n=1 Tax=Metamycoplasma hyosynoviae TaxID=29559 RepID=UPI00106633D5|nr:hypothetical protein [Metamycoplasma hyosynoviae]
MVRWLILNTEGRYPVIFISESVTSLANLSNVVTETLICFISLSGSSLAHEAANKGIIVGGSLL